jgi:phosphoribosylanthranilate isomerase
MVKIKLCGLKRNCDIVWANELRPDYVGFVFAGQRRRVDDNQAAELRHILDQQIPAVGVFVNDAMQHIEELVRRQVIQWIQLHGQEDEAYISCLRQHTGRPIIKAFSIRTQQDIETAKASSADYVLLDSGAGGTGRQFDWSHIGSLGRPYFLAGGLTPENAAAAAAIGPYAVDVSSGVETNGVKDYKKIKKFMAQIRRNRN